MRRNTTIVLLGAVLAVFALGAIVPAASAQVGASQTTQYDDSVNATEVRAQYMAEWMKARMGPEGVEAFEEQTGTTVETVAQAMAEYMGPWTGYWEGPTDGDQYGRGPAGPGNDGAGYGPEYGPGGYGPGGYGMPCGGGYGHGMGGYGHGMSGYGSGTGWFGSGPGGLGPGR
ncbi:MAG: hypothetical protein ABEJ44_06860 [Halanaeroarchaeum sp.]